MENVLVTGAGGYIGQKLLRLINGNPGIKQIVGLDIRKSEFTSASLTFMAADIRADLVEILKTHNIDTVVHLAWIIPPVHDERWAEDININGTRNVIKACRSAGVRHLLYTSSATAYGFHRDNPIPLTEDSPLRGNEDFTYARCKRIVEPIIEQFARNNPGITVTILRPCFVVGPGFNNSLAQNLVKDPILMPATLAPMQFVHEDDLVAIILKCLEDRLAGVYNVAADGTLMVAEMAEMLGHKVVQVPDGLINLVNSVAWKLRIISISQQPNAGIDMMRYPWIISNEKLKMALGYKYRLDSLAAFRDFADDIRNKKGKTNGL